MRVIHATERTRGYPRNVASASLSVSVSDCVSVRACVCCVCVGMPMSFVCLSVSVYMHAHMQVWTQCLLFHTCLIGVMQSLLHYWLFHKFLMVMVRNIVHIYIKMYRTTVSPQSTYLHQGSLDLPISRGAFWESPSTDSIDLIHEDHTRLVVPGVCKHLPDQTRTLTDVLIYNSTGYNLQKENIIKLHYKSSNIVLIFFSEIYFNITC